MSTGQEKCAAGCGRERLPREATCGNEACRETVYASPAPYIHINVQPAPVSGIPGYVPPVDPRCEFCGDPAPLQRTCGKEACRELAEKTP